MIAYPLNNTMYRAEDAALYNCPRTSGIYSGEDFTCTASGGDNTISVAPGVGWIRPERFGGMVFADKEGSSISLGLPDPILPRYDVVGARYTAAGNRVEIFAKQGKPESSPKVPAIVQTASTYELYFCKILRKPGAATITADVVESLRMDPDYCGLMADAITSVDTKAINTQVATLIEDLRAAIEAVQDGSAVMLRDGSTNMQGLFDFGGYRALNLGEPQNPPDAARLRDVQHVAQEDPEHPGCFFRMVGREKEWINPPMANGASYRTSKRYGGKPVYVVCKEATVSAKSNTIPLGIPSNATIVSSNQAAKISSTETRLMPWIDGGENKISYLIRSGSAIIYVGSSAPAPQRYPVNITVEYTK